MCQEEKKDCCCGCGCGGDGAKGKKAKKIKKILCWTLGSIVILLVVLRLFLGQIVQTSVCTIAPVITGVPVSIGDVSINVLSGYVSLSDIKVGNPEGYSADHMVVLNRAVFDIDPGSLFSEKVRVEEITVSGLDLYYVQKLNSSNVLDLKKNVEKSLGIKKEEKEKQTASAEPENSNAEPEEAKKLQVDKIQLNDITAHVVFSGVDVPIMMVPINMENLGTGPEGITAVGIFAAILDKLSLGAADAVVQAAKKSGAAALDSLKDLGKQGGDGLKEAGKNLKNLFKSK